MRAVIGFCALLWMASVYVAFRLGPPEPPRQCIPLYDQTGLECCK